MLNYGLDVIRMENHKKLLNEIAYKKLQDIHNNNIKKN